MPVERGRKLPVRRRWRTLRLLGWLGLLAAPLALASFHLAVWPLPRAPLASQDFLLYGISPALTKAFDRWHDKDPAALVVYYRLFLLYLTVGTVAAIGFVARGVRLGLKRENRGNFALLLFLQSPALIVFLEDDYTGGGRFGIAVFAAIFCIVLPMFWLFSRHMLHGIDAFEAWEARKRRDAAIEGRSETRTVRPW